MSGKLEWPLWAKEGRRLGRRIAVEDQNLSETQLVERLLREFPNEYIRNFAPVQPVLDFCYTWLQIRPKYWAGYMSDPYIQQMYSDARILKTFTHLYEAITQTYIIEDTVPGTWKNVYFFFSSFLAYHETLSLLPAVGKLVVYETYMWKSTYGTNIGWTQERTDVLSGPILVTHIDTRRALKNNRLIGKNFETGKPAYIRPQSFASSFFSGDPREGEQGYKLLRLSERGHAELLAKVPQKYYKMINAEQLRETELVKRIVDA